MSHTGDEEVYHVKVLVQDKFNIPARFENIKSLRKKYTNIDDQRIYIYGYSAGGVGCFEILKYHPDVFAAAVPICGATGWENLKKQQDQLL